MALLDSIANVPDLDTEQFAEIVEVTQGDHTLIRDLLDTFQNDARTDLEQLGALAAQKNNQELKRIMHFIAGSAANVALERLSVLCRGVEDSIDADTFAEYTELEPVVLTEYDNACRAFEAALKKI